MNSLIAKLARAAVLLPDDRQILNAFCSVTQTVDKGRDIVREGDRPEQVYIVLDGWAARYKVLRDGSRQIIAFLLPGDLCNGEISVLRKMDHSVGALTPVTIAVVGRDVLIAETQVRPAIAQALWRATLVDEAVLRAWVVNIGRRSAYMRVAHQVCELHIRLSHLGLSNQAAIDFPLTQEQLADALGLTAVHVNRVLRQLRDEGLMQLQNRTLTLLDTNRLMAVAGFDPGYLHAEAS